MNDILADAQKNKYAVGLFNTIDTDMLEAAIAAAEEARSPIVIGTAEVLLPYGDLPLIAPSLVAAAKRASVPVVVHFDHGLKFERTLEAMRLGFSSVMFDASLKPYDENIAETREIVKIAHALGITVEGEIGHVGQASSGDEGNEGMYTTVQEALDFQRATGVDALAVSVGTAHGVYKAKPKLNLERLREIRAALDTPLVLHGGSGLSDDDFRNAIRDGVAKLNIHTDLCLAGMSAMREQCAKLDPAKPVTSDYLETRTARVAAIKACVLNKLQLFGSVGKA
jgi:fructose-bisphosphate aldolase class II